MVTMKKDALAREILKAREEGRKSVHDELKIIHQLLVGVRDLLAEVGPDAATPSVEAFKTAGITQDTTLCLLPIMIACMNMSIMEPNESKAPAGRFTQPFRG